MPRDLSLLEIARELAPGETVFIAGSAGEPQEFTQLLVDNPNLAAGVRFIASFIPGVNRRNLAGAGSSRHMQVFFMQPDYRASQSENRLVFSPINYFGIQQHLAHPDTAIDTVVVQVSEPDQHGLCALGPAAEFMQTILQRNARRFAIVNSNVPYLAGSFKIPLEDFTAVARSSAPLAEYSAGGSNAVTDAIVSHLAALIPDGATIQVGLGKVPAQLLPALRGHRNLAFHSGMLSDSLCTLDAGCLRADTALIAGVIIGSGELYRRLPDVPNLHLADVGFTHHPQTLAGISRLYAVNSGLEVDAIGQVNAETLAGQYVSGPGGLPDFAAAAHRAADGLSIIALPSTDPKGGTSKIVPCFQAGTPVTIPQHDVDAVVTEYGVARLRGVSLDERRRRLIAVAHPDHRPALEAASRRH